MKSYEILPAGSIAGGSASATGTKNTGCGCKGSGCGSQGVGCGSAGRGQGVPETGRQFLGRRLKEWEIVPSTQTPSRRIGTETLNTPTGFTHASPGTFGVDYGPIASKVPLGASSVGKSKFLNKVRHADYLNAARDFVENGRISPALNQFATDPDGPQVLAAQLAMDQQNFPSSDAVVKSAARELAKMNLPKAIENEVERVLGRIVILNAGPSNPFADTSNPAYPCTPLSRGLQFFEDLFDRLADLDPRVRSLREFMRQCQMGTGLTNEHCAVIGNEWARTGNAALLPGWRACIENPIPLNADVCRSMANQFAREIFGERLGGQLVVMIEQLDSLRSSILSACQIGPLSNNQNDDRVAEINRRVRCLQQGAAIAAFVFCGHFACRWPWIGWFGTRCALWSECCCSSSWSCVRWALCK